MNCIFWSCACQRSPSRGCWQGGFSSHKVFTHPLARLEYNHWCLVLQGVYQHLGYLISLDSQPCPIWTVTWGIRSDLEGHFLFWCFRHFWRRLWSGQQIFSSFPRDLAWPPSDIFGGLHSCCWVWYSWGSPLLSLRQVFDLPTARLAALLVGSWSHNSSWFLGFPKLSEGLLRDYNQCPGDFSSCLMVLLFQDKEIFVRLFTFSLKGF